jgi:hypothetical protein
MIEWYRVTTIAAAAIVFAACGGSGSTGLILPESALLDEVRRDGVCIASGPTSFCATGSPDAVAPGGARAVGGDLFGDGPGLPCPSEPELPCPGLASAGFEVRGLPEGAACAAAARPAGQDRAPWRTGALVAVDDTPERISFPLPEDLADGAVEVVLLCFEIPPRELSPDLDALVDAGADIVFVP